MHIDYNTDSDSKITLGQFLSDLNWSESYLSFASFYQLGLIPPRMDLFVSLLGDVHCTMNGRHMRGCPPTLARGEATRAEKEFQSDPSLGRKISLRLSPSLKVYLVRDESGV